MRMKMMTMCAYISRHDKKRRRDVGNEKCVDGEGLKSPQGEKRVCGEGQ